MREIYCALSLIALMLLSSCGLIDPNGGNHPHNIITVKKIYLMNSDGTDIRFLTNGDKAAFSPDGSRIYFGDLNSVNINGTDPKQILPSGMSVWDYTFSHNGKKIVFSTFLELYTVNIDGSGLTKLFSRDTSYDFYSNECFSPEDTLIAFQFDFSICTARPDGTDRKTILVSDSAHKYYNPVFINGGNNLVCIKSDYFNQYSIINYDFKDSIYKAVYYTHPTNGLQVSSDTSIFFSADGIIQKLNPTNLNVVQLTEGYEESFSKDWNNIVYTKPNDAQKAVYVYNLLSGGVTTFQPHFQWAVIQNPEFSPDGSRILFEADSTYDAGPLY